jgi:uncharacterized protein (DUF58 family)
MLTRTGLAVGAGGFIIGALGIRFGYVEFIAVAVCATVVLVVSWLTASRLPGIEVRRDPLPQGISRGVPVPVRERLRHVGRAAASTVVLVDSLDGRDAEAAIESLVPGEEVVVSLDLPSALRGVRTVGPIRLRRTDPFGLVAVERSVGESEQLLINPKVHALVGNRGIGRFAEIDLTRRRVAPDPLAGFQSMREYVPGDDTRTIHWPSTAKVGHLMVREFDDARRPTYTIVLMTNAADYRDPADFEEAVDIAASMVVHVLEHDVDVVMRTTDPQHAGPNMPIRNDREALDVLARVQLTTDLATVPIARLMVNARQRLSVVAIGGTMGNAVGNFHGPMGDITAILVGRSNVASTVRLMRVDNAPEFALRWNEIAQ